MVMPGVVVVRGPQATVKRGDAEHDPLVVAAIAEMAVPDGLALVVIADNTDFAARSLENWLWVTFTRSDPASDVYGVGAFTHRKHWGCAGPLVIDARLKPHHPAPLVEDPAVSKRVAQAKQPSPLASSSAKARSSHDSGTPRAWSDTRRMGNSANIGGGG